MKRGGTLRSLVRRQLTLVTRRLGNGAVGVFGTRSSWSATESQVMILCQVTGSGEGGLASSTAQVVTAGSTAMPQIALS